MGWKNLKEHFGIKHIVCCTEDGNVKIGSPYVSDIVVVTPAGEVVRTWHIEGTYLETIVAQMRVDPEKVRALLAAPDSFATSIPVYTWEHAQIVQRFCEAPGWPNVTHDGHLMYENRYSLSENQVREWARDDMAAGIQHRKARVARAQADLKAAQAELAAALEHWDTLHQQFPDLVPAQPPQEED